jgi:hypothetical protein
LLRCADWQPFRRTPWETLEALTQGESIVECWHRLARLGPMEAAGFADHTAAPRSILHCFDGLDAGQAASPCLVIAPDLAGQVEDLSWLPRNVRRLLVCLYLGEPHATPARWRRLLGRPFRCHLAEDHDETRWAILDVSIPARRPVTEPARRLRTKTRIAAGVSRA